jgi:hypothetical protein
MNLPASQAAGRFLRFLQPLDAMPIRAEDLCVNFPVARRQAPQRLTNGERVALDYQLGSSLLPLPALETSASAQDRHPLTTAMRRYAADSRTLLQRRYS